VEGSNPDRAATRFDIDVANRSEGEPSVGLKLIQQPIAFGLLRQRLLKGQKTATVDLF
jgi:hypothetical protein